MNTSLISKCCFIGHRNIEISDNLVNQVKKTIRDLILNKNVSVFLFGSRSKFDDLCYMQVTKLKQIYPHIVRIYIRAEYEFINDDYKQNILKNFEDTFFPTNCSKSHKYCYIMRNKYMIDHSDYCVFFFDKKYNPPIKQKNLIIKTTKSGTSLAYNYAKQKNKNIINVFDII